MNKFIMHRNLFYMISLLAVHLCDSMKSQILDEKNIDPKSLQNLPNHNSDNIHNHFVRDPYFPEVEYPKNVLDAHKPFFHKESDSVYDPFAPEVQKNFKVITKKANNNKEKEIVTKQVLNENVNSDTKKINSEEKMTKSLTNTEINSSKTNKETAIIHEPNTSEESSDENEDYYSSNETCFFNENCECNETNSFYFEHNDTTYKVSRNATEDIINIPDTDEVFELSNGTENIDNVQSINIDILKMNDTIADEMLIDLVRNHSTEEIIPDVNESSEEVTPVRNQSAEELFK